MQPMREPPSDPVVHLDPALFADPGLVIARSERPRPRPPRSRGRGRDDRPSRPPGRRVFTHAGPVDPAYLGRDEAYVAVTYTRPPMAWNRLGAQVAVIVAVGSALGVLVAGVPH